MNTPEDKAFMDGLAGRSGEPSRDHAEGKLLRRALLVDEASEGVVSRPDWNSVVTAQAANEARYKPKIWVSAAAVLLLVVGLWSVNFDDYTTLRGSQRNEVAKWISAQPNEDSSRLATELRALGATVELAIASNGQVTLDVKAGLAHRVAVNDRLAALETGLNSEGRLRLIVSPPVSR